MVETRPVTPSRIPVGSFRVEEERGVSKALRGSMDSPRTGSPLPPNNTSRIPMPATKLGTNYLRVQVDNKL